MSLFDLQLVRGISSKESFRRGKHYVEDGSVDRIELSRLPSGEIFIVGSVYGSHMYHTTLTIAADGSEVLSYECDCLFHQTGACKHVVALGLVAARRSVIPEGLHTKHKGILAEQESHQMVLSCTYHRDRDIIRIETSSTHDRKLERRTMRDLELNGFHLVQSGVFEMSAEHAFFFLREGLVELSKSYKIVADDAFDTLANIQEQNVESDWKLSEGSGEDWLSFSVDWKCAGRELTPMEIHGLAVGYKRFVRSEDGSFVEIKNRDMIQHMFELTEDDSLNKKGGRNLSRARAIELALLAEETNQIRLKDTTQSVAVFLRDVKEGKLIATPLIPKEISNVLRPYQKDGVAWAMFLRKYHFGGILADDMGLGKTVQTLAILSTERPADAAPSLVICPKTLISIWVAESQRFTPELKIIAVEGSAAERMVILKNAKEYDVLVTSYSLFQRDTKFYRSISFYYAILDEAQYVKNRRTATALAVKTLQTKHRLALTGTPLENGVHELWSLFDFLMPGLLGNHTTFQFGFERPIRERSDVNALQNLKRRVKPFLLRRTKESVAPELPPRVEQTDWCELTQTQVALYADVLASVRSDVIAAVEKKGFARSRIEILAALTKLRQVCNHPALIDKQLSHSEDVSGKMAHALELVREAVSGGHKILLFSQFTSMLDLIRPELDKMEIKHVTIEGKTRDRATVIEQFKTDSNISVFLLSLKAAGTGLTLTEADTVILYDPWWNPMVERQAMDRAHRIGQTKSVNVHKLVTKGTIEERVLALQEKKKAIFDAMVSDTAEGFKDLTWEDVSGLFGGNPTLPSTPAQISDTIPAL